MILSDGQYEELDEWMIKGRELGEKYPELQPALIKTLWIPFKEFYEERGIDPSGRKFGTKEDKDGSISRW